MVQPFLLGHTVPDSRLTVIIFMPCVVSRESCVVRRKSFAKIFFAISPVIHILHMHF
jgi:hypothetical protein